MENTEIQKLIELLKLEDFGITTKEIKYYCRCMTYENMMRPILFIFTILILVGFINYMQSIVNIETFFIYFFIVSSFLLSYLIIRIFLKRNSKYIATKILYQEAVILSTKVLESKTEEVYIHYFNLWIEKIVDEFIKINFRYQLNRYILEYDIISMIPITLPKESDYIPSSYKKNNTDDIDAYLGGGFWGIIIMAVGLILGLKYQRYNIFVLFIIEFLSTIPILILGSLLLYEEHTHFYLHRIYFNNSIYKKYIEIFYINEVKYDYSNLPHIKSIKKSEIIKIIEMHPRYVEHLRLYNAKEMIQKNNSYTSPSYRSSSSYTYTRRRTSVNPQERTFQGKKIDFEKIHKENISVGLAGEVFIFEQEKDRLEKIKRPNLANRIEHISQTKGDGLGYDIRSYTAVGNVIYIEVKTTTEKLDKSIFFTKNEIDFLKEHKENYWLYRVYEYDMDTNTGKFIVLKGYQEIVDYFAISPTEYKGKIKMKIP